LISWVCNTNILRYFTFNDEIEDTNSNRLVIYVFEHFNHDYGKIKKKIIAIFIFVFLTKRIWAYVAIFKFNLVL